jgi:hypothetical protein
MTRALRILALSAAAVAAVYMLSVYASSPDVMPMQWDARNRPTWFAPKAAFFGSFAAVLLLGAALTFVRPAAPVGAALAVGELFLFHACRQAAIGGQFLAVPVGVAATGMVVLSLGAAGVTVVQALRSARTRGAGAPPPGRPRAS